MSQRGIEGRQRAGRGTRLPGHFLGEQRLDCGRIGTRVVERLHDGGPDAPVTQKQKQEQLDADPAPAVASRGIGGGVQYTPRILIEMLVQLAQIHDPSFSRTGWHGSARPEWREVVAPRRDGGPGEVRWGCPGMFTVSALERKLHPVAGLAENGQASQCRAVGEGHRRSVSGVQPQQHSHGR